MTATQAYLKTLLEDVIEKCGLDLELESISSLDMEVVLVLQALMMKGMEKQGSTVRSH